MDARQTLERAREAVEDAARCDKQLKALGTATNQRTADIMRSRLERRKLQDEEATASAADLVYGDDVLTDRQRDVLIQRYVLGKAWNDVARAVNSSPRQCMYDQKAALAALDAASGLDAI